jgi:hypothetical protein
MGLCFRRDDECNFYCDALRVVANPKLSSPGLTGQSSTPRLLCSITAASGILDHPLSRVMTVVGVAKSIFNGGRGEVEIQLRDLAARARVLLELPAV